jgi:hypothetical protein
MRSSVASYDINLLSEEVRRVQCARYGLMSLDESAYIIDPVMRPFALLEAKSIIRFGLRAGYYPPHYSKLLESNDVIALRLATTEAGELAHRKLDESFGIDLALGIGQMIPGVKTFAGIAGVAYYAYQAYDSFSGGSVLGGVGNLFLTLLSAAAVEPLGATAFVGPIVTALGPLTKLGKAFESFLGFIIKGTFAPVGNLLMKNKSLAAFINWVGKAGMPALEQAGGWLASKSTVLAKWLETYAVKNAAKIAQKGAEGRLASVAKYLSGKVGTAAEMMGKFITNMKTFITTGGAKWATKAEAGAAGAAAQPAAAAAAKAATVEAGAVVKAADDAYKATLASLEKSFPELAASYKANPQALLNDLAKFPPRSELNFVNSTQIRKAAEALEAAKAGAASAEAAAAKAGTEAVAPASVEGAAAAAPTTQTAGALKNLGSAAMSDIRAFHSFLDQQAGKLLSKTESAQIKQATQSMVGNPVKFAMGDGKIAKVIYADAKTGKVFKTVFDPKIGKMGAPVETSIMDLMKTNIGRNKLAEAGLNPDRFTAIARGLTRGLSAGAGEVPDAEAAAGL